MIGIGGGRLFTYVLAGWFGLVLTAALTSMISPSYAFSGVTAPNLALLVVVYVGLAGRANLGGVCLLAFLIGYVADLFYGVPIGTHVLTFSLLGVLVGLSDRLLLRSAVYTAVVAGFLTALSGLAIVLLRNLVLGHAGWGILRRVPVEALVTALVAPLVFRLLAAVDGLFGPRVRALPAK